MKKILVPTDFSLQALHAWKFAQELARLTSATIQVLHVVEFPVGSAMDPVGLSLPTHLDADLLNLLKENASKRMNKFIKDAAPDVQVEAHIDVGNPYITINETLSKHDISLVVMGTKGASGLKEFFIGSNAERVVRMARCPVITLHDALSVKDIKKIVFATNFEDPSSQLIDKLTQLQNIFDATLHLVRVNTPNNFERDRIALKLLEQTAVKYGLKNFTVNIYNDLYEDQGILAFAQDINADMIALGTHGRTGINHLISGSIAEDVVNHAIHPIWTYHIAK